MYMPVELKQIFDLFDLFGYLFSYLFRYSNTIFGYTINSKYFILFKSISVISLNILIIVFYIQ